MTLEKQFELLAAYENAKEEGEATDENCVIIATVSLWVKSHEVGKGKDKISWTKELFA